MPREPEPAGEIGAEEAPVMDLLSERRPLPGAAFRGALGRRLVALDPGWGPRPDRLIPHAGAYLCLGLTLIGLGALVGLGVV